MAKKINPVSMEEMATHAGHSASHGAKSAGKKGAKFGNRTPSKKQYDAGKAEFEKSHGV